MRGIQIQQYVSGPLDLTVSTLPQPNPTPDQYTIAIHATATNFFDLLQIRGKYQHQPPLPWVAGSEFSGVVTATPSALAGKGSKYSIGDKVFGAAQGGYATHVCAKEAQLKPVPKGWGFFEAAGLFVTMPTSYAGLVTRCNLKAGDWVLVHAAAGGVGLAAVQIAKALGATVVATAGTAHKRAVAKRFGADYTVDYGAEDWPLQVKKLTPKGRGVDIVYDPVGLVDKSTKCIAWNGRLLVVGFTGGPIEKVATNKMLLKNISVVGLHWGAYSINEPEMIDQVWDELFKLFEARKVVGTNYTDKEYVGLEDVPEALRALGSRDTWGKVVVKVPQEGAKDMAPTNYQVANTERLLGPKLRETAEVYAARIKDIDEAFVSREPAAVSIVDHNHSNQGNDEDVKVKRVRFGGDERKPGGNKDMEYDAMMKDDDDDDDDENMKAQDGNENRVDVESQSGDHRGVHAGVAADGHVQESSGEDVETYIEASSSAASPTSGLDSPPLLVVRNVKRKGVVVAESSPRIRERKSQEALPTATPRLRRQKTRIDISIPTAADLPLSSSPSSDASDSSRSGRNHQVSRIYFSPIDVNGSVVSFTDPYISEPSPPPEEEHPLTPTQQRYDDELRRIDAAEQPPPTSTTTHEAPKPRLMLKPEQVDRLVKALAECPLLHVHVSKQWWDAGDVSEATSEASGSDATPSLTGSSPSRSTLSSAQHSQSLVPEQQQSPFLLEDDEFAREYPNHPRAKLATKQKFGGIAIVDPKVHGSPTRYVSKDYRLGATTVNVGQCTFLKLPYGTTVQSHLRIEPASSRNSNCRVMLQVVNQVLERRSGHKTFLLAAELDVTESFTRAALMELAAHVDMSLDDIELLAPGIKAMHRDEQPDWCALADELQTSCAITDAVEEAAGSLARLAAETCTMQTLTLMSELERLKRRHQDFLVLRPTGYHDNGVMSGIHIPWTSQHLDQLLFDAEPRHIRGEASKAARLLRDRVAVAVAAECGAAKAFDSQVWWGDMMRLVHCVPLMDRPEGRPAAWVAFLSGEFVYLPY
ncbi:hypothetical protein LTR35_011731 [Friedmanniomyces endolithicus]|uniref:Enoyl reductase (ER) domain-containing protein n=2 Tax=Friedmanniomyces endolithicus TaxID=329885 RepID=A0AAN6FEP5_9PEZI|nr:hypothetical protein LTS00_016045 [Friedmanniomyces endolithicus]KAK0274222.1 hypothetical protein LTR35_011731 [Friedmanniomyces endolithicus]KAK0311751.1 hypothetical protein LTR82_014123 [Friedmanniomyces endolithicus]KAK0983607.1 hypothetical protein LTR54_014272 [Friedmanniomyces endolithicus]